MVEDELFYGSIDVKPSLTAKLLNLRQDGGDPPLELGMEHLTQDSRDRESGLSGCSTPVLLIRQRNVCPGGQGEGNRFVLARVQRKDQLRQRG